MTDLENALPQKNLSPSHQERVEEGWEAVIWCKHLKKSNSTLIWTTFRA